LPQLRARLVVVLSMPRAPKKPSVSKPASANRPRRSASPVVAKPTPVAPSPTKKAKRSVSPAKPKAKTKHTTKGKDKAKTKAKGTGKHGKLGADGKRRKTHPTYWKMIQRALLALGDGNAGSSVQAIRKWIDARYPVEHGTRHLRVALKKAVEEELLVKIRSSFRLAAKARKHLGLGPRYHRAKKAAATENAAPAAAAASGRSKSSTSAAAAAAAAAPSLSRGRSRAKPAGKSSTGFKWQYKNNAGSWSDYDREASSQIEEAFVLYMQNPRMNDVRAIKSGEWMYQVDFVNNKQTNIQHEHHRVRDIRRVEA